MRPSSVALLIAAALAAAGCVPTCTETCDKVLDCGIDTERMSLEECVDACTRQDALYEWWEDEAKLEAFDDHRRCVARSTSEEIADGECYEDALFVF